MSSTEPSLPKKQSVAKTFSLVALFTLLSKFAGLIRDLVVSAFYGQRLVIDAYNSAANFTLNILILFGGIGGPFYTASQAVLSSRKNNNEDTAKITAQILLWTGLITAAVSVIMYFVAPYVVPFIAGDKANRDMVLYCELIRQHLQIMAPLVFIAGLVGVGCGISNVYGEIFWPSMAPSIASISIIVSLALYHDNPDRGPGLCLAYGSLIGAIGQLIVQIPGMMRARPKFSGFNIFDKLEPGTKEYLHMLWPATIATSIGYLYNFVDLKFSNSLEVGGWTAVVNANRLIQLPLGVLGTAMLVPMQQRFNEMVQTENIEGLKSDFRKACSLSWFIALPMSAILLTLSSPIIKCLFQRGAFDDHAVSMMSTVMVCLAPMIFFYILRDLLTRVYFSFMDTHTPYRISLFAIGVKILITWLFVNVFNWGLSGIALSTTFITIMNMCLLSFFLRKRVGLMGTNKMLKPVSVMILGSIICGVTATLLYPLVTAPATTIAAAINNAIAPLSPLFAEHKDSLQLTISTLFALALSAGPGLLLYLATCYIFRLEEMQQIARRMKR